MKTRRVTTHKDTFTIPPSVQTRAKAATTKGRRIWLTPTELIDLLNQADEALNGDSNDAEHDALFAIREQLSDFFERLDRHFGGPCDNVS